MSNLTKNKNKNVLPEGVKDLYRLTPMQEGMYYVNVSGDKTSYVIQNFFLLGSNPDERKVCEATELITMRYESFRSNFLLMSKGIFQIVTEKPADYQYYDLSDLESGEQESYIRRFAADEVNKGFDLQKNILIRVRCFRLNSNTIKCLWTYHHLIMDGWSLQNAINDFVRYYTMLSDGVDFDEMKGIVANECKLGPRFKDYVTWIYKQDKESALAYWDKLLGGYESKAEIKPLMSSQSAEAAVARTGIKMDGSLSGRIRNIFKNISLDTFLKTIWGITLQKYTRSKDVVFAEVVSGRNAELDKIEQMAGMLINVVPVRVKCKENHIFREFLSQMHIQHIDSFAHSFVPLYEIQRASEQKNELIKTLFVFENVDLIKEEADTGISVVCESIREQTNYGLSVICSEESEEIKFELLYDPGKYAEKEIELLLAKICSMIAQVVEYPDIKIADIKMSCDDEEDLILNSFNSITDNPSHSTVAEIFERIAEDYPDNTAVNYAGHTLTYRQLNEKANCIAHEIRNRGIKPGELVAVSTIKSLEMIIGICGIIKSGAAFVPIDASYPVKRMEYIISDSRPALFIKYKVDAEFDVPVLDLELYEYQEEYRGNPEIITTMEDLLYCIYTSGTTGKPKGVLVPNRGVPNLRNYFIRQQQIVTRDRVLQFASMSFDAMISEITMSLLTGAALYVPPEEIKYDGRLLENYISDKGITIVILPPLLLHQLHVKGLRTIITAGAETNRDIVQNNNHIQVYSNDYGPTEATVCATYWKHQAGDVIPARIPIGKPIPNARVYIMDGLKLCGIGVPGEICIGGPGVAKGYLNRKELTADKFVKNPYNEGMLYRTGDIGRWQLNGDIEFYGRQDDQVKIRGFRIELTEIEQVIRENTELKNIVVTAQEKQSGDKYIIAYYTADEEVNKTELKKKLKQYLPEYMIPLRMIHMKTLPMTPNGKINKQALPKVEIVSEKEYTEPRSEAEKALCKACSEILGVEKAGIRDEFFELGGDSIKAIRIVSKMRTYGFELTVKDIMNRHTICAISQEAVIKQNISGNKDMVTGEIISTPMLNQFVEWQLAHPQSMTQHVMLKIDTSDEKLIGNGLEALAKQHDMLRCVFHKGAFEIQSIDKSPLYSLRTLDLNGNADAAEYMERECMKEQSRFRLDQGPLMRAVLFQKENKNKLFICIHHICIDAVSWQILLEDLHKALKQANQGITIDLGGKTTSFKDWAKLLAEYRSRISNDEKHYWQRIENEGKGAVFKVNGSSFSQKKIFRTALNQADTALLLRKTSKAYHTEINDLLICALGMAVYKTTGQEKVLVGLESHGREEICKDVAIDRTVGWFTSKYPVIIKGGADIRKNLIQVKEMLREVPLNGIGYGVIKGSFKGLEDGISFNYLGETDTGNRRKIQFNKSNNTSQNENDLTNLLDINCYIEDDRLNLYCGINPFRVEQNAAEALIEAYMESLRLIIRHCSEKAISEKTISDFSGNNLTEHDYVQICKSIGYQEADDIYELTPQQEGMLYHAVADEESTAYTIQNIFRLDSSVKAKTIKEALTLLALKHDILRAGIRYLKTDKAWQVIMKNREIEYERIEAGGENSLEIGKAEVARGFDLENDSLLRVKCIHLGEWGWRLIWTYHHIVIDGWCASILFGDFLEYCKEIESGSNADKIKEEIITGAYVRGKYSDYVKWFHKGRIESLGYWEQYLKDYEGTAKITPMYKPRKMTEQICRESIRVKGTAFAKITEFVGELKITLNTVIETAVGLMLQQYNYNQDVVFGKVVSGRNADIRDAESIVGLFSNTIPVRVNIKPGETVSALLNAMQQKGVSSAENNRCSLSEIQGLSGNSGELINVLFAFENYYINEKRMNTLGFTMEQAREQTNYSITIAAYAENNELIVSVLYNPGEYHDDEIKLILERIALIISSLCENKDFEVDKVKTITAKEEDLIFNRYNNTSMDYPKDKTIINIFEENAVKNAEETAIIDGEQMVTYDEANRKINQLASKLRSMGVKPNDFVAVISKRSIEMILGIYAVMKSGGAYVPIDPDYPQQRKEYILSDCAPKVILIFGSEIDTHIPVINLAENQVWSGSAENLPLINLPDDLAYTIYTSGTTGNPKGVMIRHHGVAAMNSYLKTLYHPAVGDRVLQYANYVFDASVWEMTMALLNGAALLIVKGEVIADAVLFEEYIVKNKMTISLLPPQLLFQLHDISCRILTTGGSASNIDVVKKAELCKRYINAYGPTENTVLAAHWEGNVKDCIYNSIPIGKPINNTRIYIINAYGLCGIGMLGELCIAGAGLARGYLNNPKLTDEKFRYDELAGEKIYHSGDLVRWLPDGNIEYLGRIDEQVKIHGFRIEPGEIESTLRAVEGVKDAVVSTCKIGRNIELCAYYTADSIMEEDYLKTEIGKQLPAYMVPSSLVRMEQFPVTPSGKVDKKKLPVYEMKSTRNKTKYVAAKSKLEKEIAEVWRRILNKDKIGISDNFFELGGNSLLVMSMQLNLNERYHHKLKVADIFSNPTIETLAGFIGAKESYINCEEMMFTESYFRTIGEKRKAGKLKKSFSPVLSRKLAQLKQSEEDNLHSLLLFVYTYVMHLETKASDVAITHLEQQQISAFRASIPVNGDLNEFQEIIWQTYLRSRKPGERTIGITKHPNALSAAFCYLPGDSNMNKRAFDFCITFGMEERNGYIEAEIFSDRTSAAGVCGFLESYVDKVERLLANV